MLRQMGENYFFATQSLANLEPTNIKYRIDNAFHMLRHFEGMDEQLQTNLLRAGHVEKNIQAELTLPGSRFFSNFALDIPGMVRSLVIFWKQESAHFLANFLYAFYCANQNIRLDSQP